MARAFEKFISEEHISSDDKESMAREQTIDALQNCLTALGSLEIAEILDPLIGREGAREKLTESLQDYLDKIGNQTMIPNSHAIHFLGNLANFFNILKFRKEKIDKAGGLSEEEKELTKLNFHSLEDFAAILNNPKLERIELQTKEGSEAGRRLEKSRQEKLHKIIQI
jgi:hypothetical protein